MLSHSVFSQNFLGVSSGNYSGTMALPLNPANAVDTRSFVFVNVAGIGFDFQNNYSRWKAPFSFVRFITQTVDDKYKNASKDKILWRQEYLSSSKNKSYLKSHINGEGRGPAINIDFKKISLGIAAGVRYRYLTSITQASDNIGRAIVEGTKSANLNGNKYTDNQFYINTGFYNEFFGTIAKVIIEDDDRMIKIGITGKYYISDMFANISAQSFDFNIVTDPNNNRKQIINLPNSQGSTSLASINNGSSASAFLSQMTKISGIGKGFGGDAGIIYEHRPDMRKYSRNNNGNRFVDPTINKYDYKIGFSLVDIGYIKFADNNSVSSSEINSTNNRILPGDFNKLTGVEQLIESVNNIYTLSANNIGREFLIYMPASSIFTFDYKIKESIFINLIWRQSFLKQARRGVIGYSGISIIPRYETKNIEFSTPISLDNGYQNLNIGLSARLGWFYIGSDNITGWLNTFNPRGLSLYTGLFIPFYHKLPKSPLKCFFEEIPIYRKRRKK